MAQHAASHAPNTEIDPREQARLQETWANFTVLVKWGVIGVVAGLVLLAWITL